MPWISAPAITDGLSPNRLSTNAVIAVIVFTFTLTLHEFVYAMTFISASDQRPCERPMACRPSSTGRGVPSTAGSAG